MYVLMLHLAIKFDFPVLVSAIFNVQFYSCVIGFLDSLTLLKTMFPDRGSYKQEDLVAGLLHATYPAHDALYLFCVFEVLIADWQLSNKHPLKNAFR